MRTQALLVAALLFLPAPSFAQQDEIDISKVRVYATAGDIVSAPITCHPTSVTFTDVGFPINADCLDGPNRWPDVTPDGWDGPIQFTYCMGLQSKADGRWAVSCVVQMWHNRQQENPNATAAPYEVAGSWFYDPRWGELKDRNPAPGETVALFIVRGNARYGTETTRPRERSNVVLVKWGQNWSAPVVQTPQQPQQPTEPQNPGQPQQPQQPTEPTHPSQPAVDLGPLSEQIERIYADLVKRDEARAAQLAAAQADLAQRIDGPGWLKAVVSNRYFQLAIATLTTYVTTHQMSKP